ncbi:uncharacterized protein LOC143191824 [Rhynchophorus ferrugineus]|uniref:uncharacterized protein LOC143191824 n=1 Tax=Rhynchophorus ferrugineus TaxID=354439 RepID=UPI003FCE6798
MPNSRQLIGSASRYISGRNAVQTVYWIRSSDESPKFLKLSKTCTFKHAPTPSKEIKDKHQVKVDYF